LDIERRTSKIEQPTAAAGSSENCVSSPADEIKLLDLLTVLAKHWKMIVCVPFVVAIITALITLFVPNVYTAKAMILPGDDEGVGMMGTMMAQMGGLAGLTGGLAGGGTKADLYVTMLRSEALKDPIIDRFKLMELYKAKFRASVYDALDGSAAISVGKQDGVITIAVSDENPKMASVIANAYVEELGKLSIKLSMSGAGKNRVFLEERLVKAKTDLAAAEETLESFQTRNKAVAVTEQAKSTLEGVAQLRAQLVAQEVHLATLQQQFTIESQEVKSARVTIANLRGQIARLEGNAANGSMPGVGAMPQLSQEYARLMREFKVQETLVELLIKQYEMTKLSETKDVAPFQILQSAKVPERKSKPKRGQIVIMSVIATGLFMIMLAFAKESSERMSQEDRQRWCMILAMLPDLSGYFRRLRDLLKKAGAL